MSMAGKRLQSRWGLVQRFAHGGQTAALALLCALACLSCGQLLGLDEDARRLDGVGGNNSVCKISSDCDDDNPCTVDSCDLALSRCQHLPRANGPAAATEQLAGDCAVLHCVAGQPNAQLDSEDIPDDGLDCTEGRCVNGIAVLTPLPESTVCVDQGGKLCDGHGSCVECLYDKHCDAPDTCSEQQCGCSPISCFEQGLSCGQTSDGCNGVLSCDNASSDGDESDIDCGGDKDQCVTRCADGRACRLGSDCISGFCAGGICDSPWSGGFGDTNWQRATGVASDQDGNVVIIGEFAGVADFGGGPLVSAGGGNSSMFVAKFSAAGQHLWSTAYGSSGNPYIDDVAIDSAGNIVLVGAIVGEVDFGGGAITSARPQAFVLKLDDLGNRLWDRSFVPSDSGSSGNAVSRVSAVGVNAATEIVLAGFVQDSIKLDANTTIVGDAEGDVFVAKLSGGGDLIFSKHFAGAGKQVPTDLACHSKGDFAFVGDFNGGVDFGGGLLQSESDAFDVFLVKLNSDGKHLFSQQYGDGATQRATGVAMDTSGAMFVAGNLEGTIDFGTGLLPSKGKEDVFIVKLTATGKHIWSRALGDVDAQLAAGIAVNERGDAVMIGSFKGSMPAGGATLSSAGSFDVFALLFASDNGAVNFSHSYGDMAAQYGRALAVTPFGAVVLVGDFYGGVDFGQGVQTSAGAQDVFLAAFSP